MTWNSTAGRLLALVALGSALSGCMDAAPGLVEPAQPTATLIGTSLHLVESTLQVGTTTVSATIGTAGGILQIPNGHSLYFPAGALAHETTIHATLDGTTIRIEFGPDGLIFPDSASPTLTLSYADGLGITDDDAHNLYVAYLDSSGAIQEILPTALDTIGDVVYAPLRHFSTYALVTD